MTKQVLVASRNVKKLAELRRVLAQAELGEIEVLGLDQVPEYPEEPESGVTFAENALIKARAGFAATGIACVADDSGLAVDVLGGMPGIFSARWSGRHGDDAANNALLLAQISDIAPERRGAGFVSVCALVDGEAETTVRGEWRGALAYAPQGEGGFGYDPIFLPEDGDGRSAGQLSPAEKDARSHRGRALAQLIPLLARLR